jgi:uncharacterized protein (DUF1697 family)
MKYLALLRGINVGGNSIIKMTDLKAVFENCGFTGVKTYLQSGNVFFEALGNKSDLLAKLEKSLAAAFKSNILVVLLTCNHFKKVMAGVPRDWETRPDLRRYIALVREPVMPQDILNEVEMKEGIDFIKAGDHVLYMSTLLSGLTGSRFPRLITKDVYKSITIRNFSTAKKLLSAVDCQPESPQVSVGK